MGGDYKQPWGAAHPGCLIVLLDQSGSMSAAFGGHQAGAGRRKSDVVATVMNRMLDDFVLACTRGTEIRARADIAALGYRSGTRVESVLPQVKEFATPAELRANTRRVEQRKRQELDDSGRQYEVEEQFSVWVDPVADGGTPMCAALARARELAERWVAANPKNYPPVVVNVTDGMATDGSADDVRTAAQAITKLATEDGAALLYNCHISELADGAVEFPSSELDIPDNEYASLLFSISSEIPETGRTIYEQFNKRPLVAGTRGYVFNGDAISVRKLLNFASVGALAQAPDPTQ